MFFYCQHMHKQHKHEILISLMREKSIKVKTCIYIHWITVIKTPKLIRNIFFKILIEAQKKLENFRNQDDHLKESFSGHK